MDAVSLTLTQPQHQEARCSLHIPAWSLFLRLGCTDLRSCPLVHPHHALGYPGVTSSSPGSLASWAPCPSLDLMVHETELLPFLGGPPGRMLLALPRSVSVLFIFSLNQKFGNWTPQPRVKSRVGMCMLPDKGVNGFLPGWGWELLCVNLMKMTQQSLS